MESGPCRSLAPAAQDGMILATLPPEVASKSIVSWPELVIEALKGDAQPRSLPKVLVIAFSNIYELAEEERFVQCKVADMSRSIQVSTSAGIAGDDVAVVQDSCSCCSISHASCIGEDWRCQREALHEAHDWTLSMSYSSRTQMVRCG